MKPDNRKDTGRGAQLNTLNPYHDQHQVREHWEGIDEPQGDAPATQFFFQEQKTIVNAVESPDIGPMWSMNPYQGCEHGCIYCYARNSHEYWGFSAGQDFEQKIVVKRNAPELLEAHLGKPGWKPEPIMLSGNTDCYQPAERRFRLTRRMLEVLLRYRHPVGMITKNALILRDLDLLKQLAELHLLRVTISITSLNEELRRKLEPRTATAAARLKVVRTLTAAGIPVNVNAAPIIPGLNDHEIPALAKAAAENGALSMGVTIVRLNGRIAEIFTDWIQKAYPDRAERVLHDIEACHGGKLNDSRFGTRMRGEGQVAEVIHQMVHLMRAKYFAGREYPPYDLSLFCPPQGRQGEIF